MRITTLKQSEDTVVAYLDIRVQCECGAPILHMDELHEAACLDCAYPRDQRNAARIQDIFESVIAAVNDAFMNTGDTQVRKA